MNETIEKRLKEEAGDEACLGEGDESFITLVGNTETGEGYVFIGADFVVLPSLLQADLLQDWIESLQDMYEIVIGGDFLKDLGATGINADPPTDAVN